MSSEVELDNLSLIITPSKLSADEMLTNVKPEIIIDSEFDTDAEINNFIATVFAIFSNTLQAAIFKKAIERLEELGREELIPEFILLGREAMEKQRKFKPAHTLCSTPRGIIEANNEKLEDPPTIQGPELKIEWEPYEKVLTGMRESFQELGAQDDEEEDDDYLSYEQNKEKGGSIPLITPDLLDGARLNNRFTCWCVHTNTGITEEIIQSIEKVPGVEVLYATSRYRFLVGMGKMFSEAAFKFDVESAIKKCLLHSV